MKEIRIRDEYIRLGQALKLAGLCDTGAGAKQVIADGLVKVNEETELRRGRKIYEGDVVSFDGVTLCVRSGKTV